MEESLRFYENVVGLKVVRSMKPMPDTEIVFLGEGETQVELIKNEKNNSPEYGKDISLGFVTSSIEKEMERLKSAGITAIQGPFQPNPTIKFFYVSDPSGVKIQFVENLPRA
jgi:lactoylglutathione lyase